MLFYKYKLVTSTNTIKDCLLKISPLYVFALAFIIQIAHLCYHDWGENLISTYKLSDAELYLHCAWFKAFIDSSGGMLGEIIPPSPYILLQVAAYKIFGFHYYTPFITNTLLASGAAVFMYLFSANLFNKKIGLISGLIFIFCGPLLFYSSLTMKTVSVMFMLTGSLYFLERSLKTLKPVHLICLSFFIALLILERNNFLLEAPLIILIALIGKPNKFLITKRLTCLVLPCIITLFIFLNVFNHASSTSPIGINLYSGNSKIATGSYVVLEPLIRDDLIGSHKGPGKVAEQALGKKLTTLEVNQYWIEKTINDIIGSPVHFIKILSRKVLMVLSRDAPGSPEQYALWRWDNPFLKIALFDHGLILALAILGILIALKNNDNKNVKIFILIPLIYSLTVIIFFINERYRFPIMITLIPFASLALYNIFTYPSKKQKLILITCSIILYGSSYLANTINPIGPGWTDSPKEKRKTLLEKRKINKLSYIYKKKALQTNESKYWQLLSKAYQRRNMLIDAKIFNEKAQEFAK